MRFGFFLGFMIGAAVASVLSKVERGEAPAVEETAQNIEHKIEAEAEAATSEARGALEQLKAHAREALDAAKEAADEKEAELMKEFEQTTKGEDKPTTT